MKKQYIYGWLRYVRIRGRMELYYSFAQRNAEWWGENAIGLIGLNWFGAIPDGLRRECISMVRMPVLTVHLPQRVAMIAQRTTSPLLVLHQTPIQVAFKCSIIGGCDSTGWSSPRTFTTLCPTVIVSGAATQAKTTTTAIAHFHTDYAVNAGVRYYLQAGGGDTTYIYDADADSLQHTLTMTGLTPDYTYYKWEYMTHYATCDSSTYAGNLLFYTACEPIAVIQRPPLPLHHWKRETISRLILPTWFLP